MNGDNSPPDRGQDGPLMDFFLAVAGAWKLLIILPVVVGVLVWGGMQFGRPTMSDAVYRSQATIYSVANPERELSRSMERTDSAEMSVQAEVGDFEGLDVTRDLTVVPLGNGFYEITLDQAAPSSAQATLNEVLSQASSRFAERDEKRLVEAQNVLNALKAGLARQQSLYDLGMHILSEGIAPATDAPPATDTARSAPEQGVITLWREVAELTSRIEERQADIVEAEESLAGYRITEIVAEPSPDAALPNPQISSMRIGVLAALVSGLVLLLVVFTRHRVQTLFQEPAMRNRLRRVLSEL